MGQHSTDAERKRRPPPLWLDIAWILALTVGVLNLVMGARYALGSLAGPPSPSDALDFRVFYQSAAAWRSGHDLYAGPEAIISGANMNPPVFILLLVPFTSLPMPHALLVWWILNFAALGVASAFILRELSLRVTGSLILLWVLFAGTQAQIILGQVAWVCMLVATLAWRDWRHRKMVRAGLWLGLLVGLKPFFMPVLAVAFLRKQFTALGAAVGMVLATVIVGALGSGWSAYASWIQAGSGVHWYAMAYNASLRGVVARVFNEAVGRPIWIAAALAVLGYAVWRLLRHDPDADQDLSVAFLTSLLVSPLGWVYYLPVALAPIIAILRRSTLRWWGVAGLIGLFWPPGVGWAPLASALDRTPRNAVVGSLYAFGLMTLWWLCLHANGEKDLVRRSDPRGGVALDSLFRESPSS